MIHRFNSRLRRVSLQASSSASCPARFNIHLQSRLTNHPTCSSFRTGTTLAPEEQSSLLSLLSPHCPSQLLPHSFEPPTSSLPHAPPTTRHTLHQQLPPPLFPCPLRCLIQQICRVLLPPRRLPLCLQLLRTSPFALPVVSGLHSRTRPKTGCSSRAKRIRRRPSSATKTTLLSVSFTREIDTSIRALHL